MILHLQQLQNVEDLCVDLDGQRCDFPADAGKIRAPIHLEAHIRKVGHEVAIEGHLSTQVEVLCARCLKPHKEVLSETFEVVYCPKPVIPEDADEVELEGGELDCYYYEGETISLFELVHDQLILMIPVKPLCRPDCAGLCPLCGRNLNNGLCECASQTVDPRLAVLGKLLKEQSPVS
jgi:uncharacterized protein